MNKTSINTTFNAFVKLKIQDGGYRFRQIRKKKKKNDGKKSNEIQNGCVCTYTDDNIRIESICKQEICFSQFLEKFFECVNSNVMNYWQYYFSIDIL